MLHVLTLNLNYLVGKHGAWPRRRDVIRAVIEQAGPDLLAFQAVRRDPAAGADVDQAGQLAGLCGYAHVFFQPAVADPDGPAEGSAIVARIAPAEVDHRLLTLLPGLEDAARRLVLRARFDLPGGPFHLFNAHFSWVAEQTRLNAAEALPYLAAARGAALLVGDLNAPADEDRLDALRDAGWTDVWAALRLGEPGYTFESNAPSTRIDYAWANQALAPRVRAIEIIAGAPGPSGERASDHLGLLVSLDI